MTYVLVDGEEDWLAFPRVDADLELGCEANDQELTGI